MAFIVSDWITPIMGDGDGGGNSSTPEKLPLPYWVNQADERFVNLKAEYQVPKLLYMVFRNGVLQQPKVDFTFLNAATLEFVEPFVVVGETVCFFPTGFHA